MRVKKIPFLLLFLAGSGILWCAAPAEGKSRTPKLRVLRMKATAFSQEANLTRSGTVAREGIVAADPSILPLGTRIRVRGAGPYDGFYLVTDTGAKVDGNHIDIYLASDREAKRFGVKRVKVTVLEKGEGAEDAREKDAAVRPPPRAIR